MGSFSRRAFLQALTGGIVALSAGGIALLEASPIERAYFLPPRCGWNAGSWELLLAQKALTIVGDKLGNRREALLGSGDGYIITASDFWIGDSERHKSLLASHTRLTERVAKLVRGWQPTVHYRPVIDGAGQTHQIKIHGNRFG